MELLYILLILLFVTRTFGEVAHRMGLPALLGELFAGIALGVIFSSFSEQFPIFAHLPDDKVFVALSNLGIFFLMLLGGVELRTGDLAEVSKNSFIIGFSGLLLPVVVGFSIAWSYLPDSDAHLAQSLFVGTALAITAVPVSIGVLMQLGKLRTPAGKTIVSAAIIDDILSLILLAFLTGIIKTGAVPSLFEIGKLLASVGLFFFITASVAWLVVPRVGKLVTSLKTAEFEFTSLLLAALAFADLAEFLHLHWILGAFVAGLLFEKRIAGEETYQEVKKRISAISTGFLAPIFFASIGLNLDLKALSAVPGFVLLLVVVAFLTKLIGAGLPAYWTGLSKRDALAVGVGMSARGAVELVVADVALKAGVFSVPVPTPPIVSNLFSTIVIVALVTTLATPFLLKMIFTDHVSREA